MKKLLVSALAATVLSFGIGSEVTAVSAAEPQAVTKSNILTMAAVWKQTAAEYRALYYQGFNIAQKYVDEAVAKKKKQDPLPRKTIPGKKLRIPSRHAEKKDTSIRNVRSAVKKALQKQLPLLASIHGETGKQERNLPVPQADRRHIPVPYADNRNHVK